MTRNAMIVTLAVLALGASSAAVAQTRYGQATSAGDTRQCCFNNQRYAGTCQVTLSKSQSCSEVTSFLNNFGSVDMGYCNFTDIRGGWAETTCQAAGSSSVFGDATFVTPTDASVTSVQPQQLQAVEPSDATIASEPRGLRPMPFG